MPLIQIKTRNGWHVESELSLAHQLGKGLPPSFLANPVALRLEEGTTEGDVEVDFPRYDDRAINVPDIGVFVLFTEDPPSKKEQREVRNAVEEIVEALLDDYEQLYQDSVRAAGTDDPSLELMSSLRPNYTVDCFWGPGTGCMIFRDREPKYW